MEKRALEFPAAPFAASLYHIYEQKELGKASLPAASC